MDTLNDQDKAPKDQANGTPETSGSKPSTKAVQQEQAREAESHAPTETETLETRITQLREEIRDQGTALQDVEVSLVQRIADVDDDRRQTAARIHRSLQAQHEETDERLRRQTSLILVMLLLALLVIGAGLTFAYYRFDTMRQSLAAKVEDVKQTLEGLEIPETSQLDSRTSARLETLSTTVESLSVRLDHLGEQVDTVSNRVDSFSKQVSSVNTRVDSASKQVSLVSNRIDSFSEQVSSVSNRVDSFSEQVSSISKQVDSFSEQVSSVSNRVDSVSEQVGSVNNRVDSAREQVSSVSNRLDSVSEQVGSVSNRVDSVSEQVSSTSKQVDSVSKHLSSLSNRVDSASKQVSSVNNRVDSVSNHLSSVSKQVDSVEKTLTEAETAREHRSPSSPVPAAASAESSTPKPSSGTPRASRDDASPGDEATTAASGSMPPEPEPAAAPVETSTSGPASKTTETQGSQTGRIDLEETPFTLQLIGVYSMTTLDDFVREHESELPNEIYYQTTSYRGRPWYVLIHSLHGTRDSADRAANKLPEDLATLDIWIHRLAPDEDVRRYDRAAVQ